MDNTVIKDNIRFEDIAELAKYKNIIWLRDGSHSIDDLQIILKFWKLGFNYKLSNYKGEFEKNAIKVEFYRD